MALESLHDGQSNQSNQTNQTTRTPDYLALAVQSTQIKNPALEPLPYSQPKLKDIHAEQAEREAEAARSKLAQEHLLDNPAEMRKIFPRVLNDVSVNHNGHIDMYEIEQGLKNPKLDQAEKDLLVTFRQGYDNLRLDWSFGKDADGISETSLAMIDKAMNRSIDDDPHFEHKAISKPIISGAAAGVSIFVDARFRAHFSTKEALILGGIACVAGAIYGEGTALIEKYFGEYDNQYDNIKNDYQSFVKDFHHNKTALEPSAVSQR